MPTIIAHFISDLLFHFILVNISGSYSGYLLYGANLVFAPTGRNAWFVSHSDFRGLFSYPVNHVYRCKISGFLLFFRRCFLIMFIFVFLRYYLQFCEPGVIHSYSGFIIPGGLIWTWDPKPVPVDRRAFGCTINQSQVL